MCLCAIRLMQNELMHVLGVNTKGLLHHCFLFLDIDRDVHKVKGLLANLKNEELKDLFVELGLSDATVQNNYSGSVTVYANDLIRLWILGKDDVLKSVVYPGGATWENLRKGLSKLKHFGIMENI